MPQQQIGIGAAPNDGNGETARAAFTKVNANSTDAENRMAALEAVGATDDQTGAEIKVAYEGEADTNAFTDAEQTKLGALDAAAAPDQTGAEIKVAYEGEADTNAFTDAEQTKLGGIEASATADQTGAEIKVAYEGEANTNAFTDADKARVSGRASIVKSADQSKISDPAIAADSELAFAMGAGETWLFSASIVADEGANNPNIKFRMGASGGLTGTIEYSIISEVEQEHLSDFTTVSGIFTLSTTKRMIRISGAVKTVLAGTLSVEWAQNITDTDPTTVYACSTLSAIKTT